MHKSTKSQTEPQAYDQPPVSISNSNRFGDPESALEKSRIELGTQAPIHNGEYYVPPISFLGLSTLTRVNPHHGTLAAFKANLLVKYMQHNDAITRSDLRNAATDKELIGNTFLQKINNKTGRSIAFQHLPAINMRRMVNDALYCHLLPETHAILPFNDGEVVHGMEYEPIQQIYGIPYWIGAAQSILLSEDVRIFPRLFFKNGGSTGDLLVTSGLSSPNQDIIDYKIGSTKGKGRFKRVIVQLPTGDIDQTIKSIPYSTGSEKIDFSGLANMTKSDILESRRIPPELAGMMPSYVGSRDIEKLSAIFHENEIIPMQQFFEDLLNPHLPKRRWLRFREQAYYDKNN